MPHTLPHRAGLAIAILLFGLPLYVGLDTREVANDEAIYSYAVERILETGHWLTPRSIPHDGPFLEKPPLKFWMVAAPIAAGLVPATEPGMRLLDVTFGLLAIAYVYLLGARLAGPICGIAAAFVLFTFHTMVTHAFRMNHMDGALVLAYCGGLFHFIRWMEAGTVRDRRLQPLAVALYFTLAFMTKFVAAFFLPLICAAALLVHPERLARLRTGWRDWMPAAALAVALIVPWFVYEALLYGSEFWRVIVGEHVYTRFAGTFHPEHLAPWHYYVTATWRELGSGQMRLLVVGGLVLLAAAAPGRGGWQARVVLLWLVLPYTLLSFGTSKLLHYMFPFFPALALAGGYAVARAVSAAETAAGGGIGALRRRFGPLPPAWATRLPARAAMVVMALLAAALAVWTARTGRVTIEMGDTLLFRNTSILRPLVVATICLGLAGLVRASRVTLPGALVLVLVPIGSYEDTIRHFTRTHEPVRALRDCVVDVHARTPGTAPGVLVGPDSVQNYIYYFYFRHAGPWEIADAPGDEAILRRAALPGAAFVTTDQFEALESRLAALAPATGPGDPSARRPAGVLMEPGVVALLPGPFAACVPHAIAGGASPLPAIRVPIVANR